MISIRRCRDDDGVMLLFAIIIITTVALVTGLLLAQGGTNFAATVALRGASGTSYSADAAANAAISYLQRGEDAPDAGATYPPVNPSDPDQYDWVFADAIDGAGCFGNTDADGAAPYVWSADDPERNQISLDNIYPASGDETVPASATVVCEKVNGTGLFGSGPPVTGSNRFARAVTTRGDSDGDGLYLEGNADLQMRGGIASNTFVRANDPNTNLFTDGYVRAATAGCSWGSGTITSDPAKVCPYGFEDHPEIADPLTSVPDYRDPAEGDDCNFVAGYYNDADALTDATDDCTTSFFQPGIYYFDFQNDGDHVWTINRGLVGGHSTGATIPGRCASPIDDDNRDVGGGVQFVFGGDSRIALGKVGSVGAHVELCGEYSEGTPPIALRQQMTGSSPATGNRTATAATVSTAGTSNPTPWAPAVVSASRLQVADTNNAVWANSSNSNRTAVLALSAWNVAPAIPPGATLTSARLRVRHSQTGAQAQVPTASITQDGTTTNLTPSPVWSVRPTLGWDEVDVTTALADAVSTGTLNPTITLRIASGRQMTWTVDAVELVLTFETATLTEATLVDLITNGGGSSFQGAFVVQGAIYAPRGRIDMSVGVHAEVIAFRYGIVAWGISFTGLPQYLYGYPLVSIPDEGPGFGRNVTAVDLSVYVCPGGGNTDCPVSDDKLELKVRVKITDDPGSNAPPQPGHRKIEVLSWADQR